MKVEFEEHGTGKPIVLLHAFPLSRKMWQGQIDPLVAENCRVILPDLRGFGENHNFADINTMEDLAKDIGEFLDNLKIEKAIIGGLSMGGYVTFNLYRLFPEKFAAMILADTNCAADTDEKRESRFVLIEEIETDDSHALIKNMLPNLTSEHTKTNNEALITQLREEFSSVKPKGVIAALRGMAGRKEHCSILESISVPTLLIFGEHDKVTNLEIAQQMQSKIKFSTLQKISNAGHYSNLEQPEQFNKNLVNFVQSIQI